MALTDILSTLRNKSPQFLEYDEESRDKKKNLQNSSVS